MKKEITIRIETLQLIKDPKAMFETDKVLVIDVFDITDMQISNLEKIKLKTDGKAFNHEGRIYLPIILKGSPENLFLNSKNGFPCKIGNTDALLFFDGKLTEMFEQKKIYDISHCYKKKGVDFRADFNFLIERYILTHVTQSGLQPRPRAIFTNNILTRVV